MIHVFQLTHPTRGATAALILTPNGEIISTHTPHTGCDSPETQRNILCKISTHTPHTGCDCCACEARAYRVEFQLTHPTRGATMKMLKSIEYIAFQLTHPTRGATKCLKTHFKLILNFNSHTPHGVRPIPPMPPVTPPKISTHTPHTGCDQF